MNYKNLSINAQIKLGFYCILALIAALAIVVMFQAESLWQGTKGIYDHPLAVRRALDVVKSDIGSINAGMKDLCLAKTGQQRLEIIQDMDSAEWDVESQFAILYERYLGPREHLNNAHSDFIQWKALRNETNSLLQAGRTPEALARMGASGDNAAYVQKMMGHFSKIDRFALTKGDQFYRESLAHKNRLTISLWIFFILVLLVVFAIVTILMRGIQSPLSEIIRAAQEFKNGNLKARSSYSRRNEFGKLSDAFNELAETIQMNIERSEKLANLAGLMLSEYDAKKFFQTTLNALAVHTGSQMAAIYLLSEDNKTYEHFESMGMGDNARQSFAADTFEGEFGPALFSRKVQHLKNISDDTRFVFHTVSGKFVPHEILTLPILADKKVIAVISLASVKKYHDQSLRLIDDILVILCARIEGILSYHTIQKFSAQLKSRNMELQAQQSELTAQSIELTGQNRELEMQKRKLDEAGRLKTEFLSNMSHELRTPLNSVIALSGVLGRRLKGKLPAEEYGYIDVIERNGRMLLSLINDILDIARIESGREDIEITCFSPDTLIADVVEMLQPQAVQKNIILRHHRNESETQLESDADKCRHILQNVIGNAVKFTEKGAVEVSARQMGNALEIAVIDTGIGIAPEYMPHIFEEFRQADSGASRRYGGTGLGLAIAKKYTVMLGGGIVVSSEPRKGSTFTITLPLSASAGLKATEARVVPHGKYPSGPGVSKSVPHVPHASVLLVDDSEPVIVQMRDILGERGYRIAVAHGGAEALDLIGADLPDVVILDLMMPGVDGFAVLKSIREEERSAHVPVLILTAKHITKEELSFLKRNNIHQLIQKGDVNRDDLLASIDALVCKQTEAPQNPSRVFPIIAGKPVVLVVEDNPDGMLTMKALLNEDFTILEAADGQVGVAMAQKHIPHLVLMDIGLPGKDGIEAFTAIRKNPDTAHIPVIAVTASAMTTDREAILAYGFDAYVAKPIDARVLFTRIREVLYGK